MAIWRRYLPALTVLALLAAVPRGWAQDSEDPQSGFGDDDPAWAELQARDGYDRNGYGRDGYGNDRRDGQTGRRPKADAYQTDGFQAPGLRDFRRQDSFMGARPPQGGLWGDARGSIFADRPEEYRRGGSPYGSTAATDRYRREELLADDTGRGKDSDPGADQTGYDAEETPAPGSGAAADRRDPDEFGSSPPDDEFGGSTQVAPADAYGQGDPGQQGGAFEHAGQQGQRAPGLLQQGRQPAVRGQVTPTPALTQPGFDRPGQPLLTDATRPGLPLQQTDQVRTEINENRMSILDDIMRIPEEFRPVGMHFGAFRLYTKSTVGLLATDNATEGTNGQSDTGLELDSDFRAVSNWNRHGLALQFQSSNSFFANEKDADDKTYLVRALGRVDVTRRTKVDLDGSYELSQESASSTDIPAAVVEKSPIHTWSGSATLSHRFNRLSATVKGTAASTDYTDVALGAATLNNDDRDLTEYEGTLRLAWQFSPAMSVFAEGLYNLRDYAFDVDDQGITRGSRGKGLRGGVEIDFGPKLKGDVSLGYRVQTPDDSRLASIGDITFDGSMTWSPRALTTLTLTTATGVDETTDAVSTGAVTRTFGFEVEHYLRRDFLLKGDLDYSVRSFSGSANSEDTFGAALSTEYFLSRNIALNTSYTFTKFSTNTGPGYEVNEARIGATLRR